MGDDKAEHQRDLALDAEVAEFDHCIESFSSLMEEIEALGCGSNARIAIEADELDRFSSMITFLREWKYFSYDPKVVKFDCVGENLQGKGMQKEINLPQFSSAAVPKVIKPNEERSYLGSNDFILHAGGLVWALDWCPIQAHPDTKFNCEYLAVAAHPSGSMFHKIGEPLVGRGMIQIWCVLSLVEGAEKQEEKRTQMKPASKTPGPKGFSKKKPLKEDDIDFVAPRPRGRPRKTPVKEITDLAEPSLKKPKGRPRKHPLPTTSNTVSYGELPECSGSQILITDICLEEDVDFSASKPIRRTGSKPVEEKLLDQENDDVQTTLMSKGNSVRKTMDAGEPSIKKLRGRLMKHPLPTVAQTDSKEELPECSNNQIHSTSGHGLPLLSTPGSNSGVLPASDNGSYEKESSEIRRSNRPKRKPLRKFDDFILMSDEVTSKNLPAASPNVVEPVQLNFGEQTIIKPLAKLNKCIPSNGQDKRALPVLNPIACIEKAPQARHKRQSKKKKVGECVSIPGDGAMQEKDFSVLANLSPQEEAIQLIDVEESRKKLGANKLKYFSKSGVVAEAKATLNDNEETDQIRSCGQTIDITSSNVNNDTPVDALQTDSPLSSVEQGIFLPRIVLCLAHNGKVAWDAKWRPLSNDLCENHHLGYLAVLLGNGSLEVWEIPRPKVVRTLHASRYSEETDPRFLKLEPVFRCTKIKNGDGQSIPMVMEWSPGSHDLILAGCHDGTVALWKFCKQRSCQDTRPLLCFTADSVAIRALAWAPDGSDSDSSNLIITAGQDCLKFWDLRDPYHPLWELNPAPRTIFAVDWLDNPSCVFTACDNGSLMFISLSNAAYDVPVTGKSYTPGKNAAFNNIFCSSFALWSVHVSRSTGFAAYCGADGFATRFQLTTRFVEKDRRRVYTPHFLCGSLEEENTSFKVNIPLPDVPLENVPFSQKKPIISDCGDTVQTGQDNLHVPCFGDQSQHNNDLPSGTKTSSILKGQKTASSLATEVQEMKKDKLKQSAAFPPKSVAMYKVRWNPNKGSERWLCYGGAAGIVRCQQIILS